jgi:hypothetical protein
LVLEVLINPTATEVKLFKFPEEQEGTGMKRDFFLPIFVDTKYFKDFKVFIKVLFKTGLIFLVERFQQLLTAETCFQPIEMG